MCNEEHYMMVSLYGPEGELLIGGVGFLHHLTGAAQAVKHIIRNFSEDPGFQVTVSCKVAKKRMPRVYQDYGFTTVETEK